MPTYLVRNLDAAIIRAARANCRREEISLDEILRAIIVLIASYQEGDTILPITVGSRASSASGQQP